MDNETAELIEEQVPEQKVEADVLDAANDAEIAPEAAEVSDESAEPESEIVVSIGEEPPPQEDEPAPAWVRELRKANREDKKRIRDLEEKLQSATAGTKPPVMEKPTLEGCDFDADVYEREYDKWKDQQTEQKREAELANQAKEAERKDWDSQLQGYETAKKNLKVTDYQDAEETVQETLNVTQQGIIVKGAANPALVVYALGKNPSKAKELAAIKDPVKFAFAVANLETKLKVTQAKAPPPPERTVRGTGSASSVDSTIERLRTEALRTGDATKLMSYKKQLRDKAK